MSNDVVTKLIIEAGFGSLPGVKPSAFIQWKGTNVCMDFYCECGSHCHFDGTYAYAVKCPTCSVVWEMPDTVYPRKADQRTPEYWRKNPAMLEHLWPE